MNSPLHASRLVDAITTAMTTLDAAVADGKVDSRERAQLNEAMSAVRGWGNVVLRGTQLQQAMARCTDQERIGMMAQALALAIASVM